jgi:hypothetical protein
MNGADAEERISHSGSLNHESDILHGVSMNIRCSKHYNGRKSISKSKVHPITDYKGLEGSRGIGLLFL